MLSFLRVDLRQQKYLVLLFCFTVLLPALLLILFGFRLMEADSYRVERLFRNEQESALQQLRTVLEERLDRIGVSLGAVLKEVGSDGDRWSKLRSVVLSPEGVPIPGIVITLTPSGALLFVKEGYLYSMEPPGLLEDAELIHAQRVENSPRGARKAVRLYERLAEESQGDRRMMARNALGRALQRSGDDDAAFETYRRLIQEWPSVLREETAVFPMIAGLQLASLSERLGNTDEAIPLLVNVYRYLFDDLRILSSDQAEFYGDAYEEVLDSLCIEEQAPDCQSYELLREARPAGSSRIRQRERLKDLLLPLLSSMANREAQADRQVIRMPRGNGLVVYAVDEPRAEDDAAHPPLLATILLDTRLGSLLPEWSATPDGNGIHYQIRGTSEKLIYGTEPGTPLVPFLEEQIGGSFPDWTATVYHGSEAVSRGLVEASRNFYLLVVTGLFGLFACGSLLTFRAIVREQEITRLKASFVSIVSHEFKSPLTSMRTLMERLQGGLVRDGQRRQLYYDVVCSELQRLTRLINNLLDVLSIERGEKAYQLEMTDLGELLENLLTTFEPRAEQKGFAIEKSIPESFPPVRVDRDAISQAILNLLDNAVKYSPDEKFIRVSLKGNKGSAAIEVTDRGEGIPPEERERIFDSSFRGEGKQLSVPGVGIGLAVVKHVAEAHGGHVEVKSSRGAGSTFTLRFPFTSALKGSDVGNQVKAVNGNSTEDVDLR